MSIDGLGRWQQSYDEEPKPSGLVRYFQCVDCEKPIKVVFDTGSLDTEIVMCSHCGAWQKVNAPTLKHALMIELDNE